MILLSEFWNMGGYAIYIWPAYGVSMAALFIIGWMSFRRMKTLDKRLGSLKKDRKK